MKARVYVWMKSTVLDPQGKAVCSALQGHGHPMVADVRQGKYFEIALAPGTLHEKATAEMDAIAKEVLSNPVIEDYRVEILES
jgi:phosphoribosylformylglycinamidine synthase PurS subunit